MSVRHEVAALLASTWATIPALAGVRVIATERDLDAPTQPTALIRVKTVARTPEAPNSHRTVGLLLTLISPADDADAAADELDELLEAVLDDVDTRFLHDEASLVGYGDRLAFDIPLTILASKG